MRVKLQSVGGFSNHWLLQMAAGAVCSDDNIKKDANRYTLSPMQSIFVGVPSGCLVGIFL
jgi:hypothetical protein